MRRIVLGICLAAAAAASAATFHVDVQSRSAGDGSSLRPWRTVGEAVTGIRSARKSGVVKVGESIEVRFRSGDYFVGLGVELGAEDSGGAGAPVVWCAEEKARVRLTGGIRVPVGLFQKVEDPAVLARIPEEARGRIWKANLAELAPQTIPPLADMWGATPSGPLLIMGGSFATLARWPNEDFTSFTKGVDKGNGGPGAFIYENPRAKRWNFSEGVWLNGYWTHDWDNRYVRAAGYGAENGTNNVVRLAAQVPYGVLGGTWGRADRRFFVFNVLDELDRPGEWWLDRTRKILYVYPPKGTPRAEDDVTLVFNSAPILTATGIRHVVFRDLGFECNLGTGVVVHGSDVCFENCRIANVGGTGLDFMGDRNRLCGTEICGVGRGGVHLAGGDRRTLRRADSVAEDCHIHHFALFERTYAPAFRVDGCGVTLRRNRVHDAPHSAVLYGGNEHLFECNDVSRVLLETGDAGAYYTGRDWTTMGNVLRHNYTHDLGAEGEQANTMGFYFDDCDCGDAVYGNVFHNVARGIMVGGGREHPIRNNIFSKCLIGLSIDCRGMTWNHWNSLEHGGPSWMLEDKAKALDYTRGAWAERYPLLAKIMQDHPREPLYNPVETNVFIDCVKDVLCLDKTASQCLERMAPIRGNLVINTQGTNGVRTARVDARIAAGFRIVNGTAEHPFDAGFVDAARGDFTLRPDAWLKREMPAFQPIQPLCVR